MRSSTEHITINTDHRHLFAFLADPGNLPARRGSVVRPDAPGGSGRPLRHPTRPGDH